MRVFIEDQHWILEIRRGTEEAYRRRGRGGSATWQEYGPGRIEHPTALILQYSKLVCRVYELDVGAVVIPEGYS